jgi:hypothetical protein
MELAMSWNAMNKAVICMTLLFLTSTTCIAGPLEDLRLGTDLAAYLEAGKLSAVEEGLTKFENPQLKMVWASNLLVKYFEKNDLAAVENVLRLITDSNLRKVWVSNIVLKSLELKDCSRAKRLIESVDDANLRPLWDMNYKLRC